VKRLPGRRGRHAVKPSKFIFQIPLPKPSGGWEKKKGNTANTRASRVVVEDSRWKLFELAEGRFLDNFFGFQDSNGEGGFIGRKAEPLSFPRTVDNGRD